MLQADASKKVMTKLPANLFCDFSENGGLARILCCALRYKNEKVGGRDVQCPRNVFGLPASCQPGRTRVDRATQLFGMPRQLQQRLVSNEDSRRIRRSFRGEASVVENFNRRISVNAGGS